MKHAAVILLAVLLTGRCSEKREPEAAQQPSCAHTLAVSDSLLTAGEIADTLRLGVLHSGERISSRITLFNCGTAPLAISRIESGCACLQVDAGKSPLEARQSRPVQISLDTHGLSGWMVRRADIHIAGVPCPVRIWIEAEVR